MQLVVDIRVADGLRNATEPAHSYSVL